MKKKKRYSDEEKGCTLDPMIPVLGKIVVAARDHPMHRQKVMGSTESLVLS